MQFSLMHERQATAIAIVTLEILNAERIHIYFSIQFCPHIWELLLLPFFLLCHSRRWSLLKMCFFSYAEQSEKKYIRCFIIFIGPTELCLWKCSRQNGNELIFHCIFVMAVFQWKKKNTFILIQFHPCAAQLKSTISLGTKAFAAHAYGKLFSIVLTRKFINDYYPFFLSSRFSFSAFNEGKEINERRECIRNWRKPWFSWENINFWIETQIPIFANTREYY